MRVLRRSSSWGSRRGRREMSCATMKMRTAWLKSSASNSPLRTNFTRLREARLQAESSREHIPSTDSRHGCGQTPQGCQSLMVVSNCMPGSPQRQVSSAIFRKRALGSTSATVLLWLRRSMPNAGHRFNHSHERVDHADRVVSVLVEDRGVCFESGLSRRIRRRSAPVPWLLPRFARDEALDIGMVRVQDRHLGCPACLATRLDHTSRKRRSRA